MTTDDARKLVLVSLVIVGTVAAVDSFGKGNAPPPREFLAGGIAYIVLGGLADIAPAIAGPFAILLALTVTLNRGQNAARTLIGRLK